MYRDKPGIEVSVKLDWREQHKMLKLSFPVQVTGPKVTCEIPYGFIERPANGEEEPFQTWLDVSGTLPDRDGQMYGLALLNDAKYSYDVKDNDMRMTVVRSPIFADHYGVRDEWCDFMDQGVQEFRYALVPHAGGMRDSDAPRRAMELNAPPIHVVETYHKGTLPQKHSGIGITTGSVIATVFKQAEDGDAYIVRCYESAGTDCEAVIELPMLNRTWQAHFGKCEIKTFRIPENPLQDVIEVNLLELPMES